MIFVSDISQLDYYNSPEGAPCYCEALIYPSDLVLQAFFSSFATSYTLTISVLTADGITVLEADSTSYFDYYFFNYNGLVYCNIRLKTYSPAMCSNPCWILRVTIESGGFIYFDKYTQRYCQSTCCDIPRGITGIPDTISHPHGNVVQATVISIPTTACRTPLIRITSNFDCLDNQTGEFYGLPTNVISGSASFSFTKITNIAGRIRQQPRTITREVSYNCNLQRSSSFKPFVVDSNTIPGTFPLWKMNEMEVMFHANEIIIDDFGLRFGEQTYQFYGGVVIKKIENAQKCWELFQLSAEIQSCTIRQIFGCRETCEPDGLTYLIPQNYGGGYFYSENRAQIGTYDDLLLWYRAQDGITSVEIVNYDNTWGAFRVTGTGYIPTFFYFDAVTPRNKVYGTTSASTPEVGCIMPEIGSITVTDQVCETPTIGSITVTAEDDTVYALYDYYDWEIQSGEVTGTVNGKLLNIVSRNTAIVATDPLVFLNTEIIGQIEPGGEPDQIVSLTSETNGNIPVGSVLSIDTLGTIRYTGYPTESSGEYIQVTLLNIYY